MEEALEPAAATTAAAALLGDLLPSLEKELSVADVEALVGCCADLLDGGGEAEASRGALDALAAVAAVVAGGDRLRCHVDALLPIVVGRLGDANASVREAARRLLMVLMETKEINARAEKTEQAACLHPSHCMTIERESSDANQERKIPKVKVNTKEISIFAGQGDITKKRVETIKISSEKELIRQLEKIASTLQPEREWSIRLTAMQRIEGLVLGGAADYSAFPMLLKQLVTPIISQLLDRRSSIVKQACHLLSFLSKELLRDFEPCAELLIPVLLKIVVITVFVIAESADSCIKEMLRNCKVSRILPRIVESAKNDKSAVLRARCCNYALLMLEYWADTPEIHRSADLYEELIKCCIADATNEVRSTARLCYRIFSKFWPERSHYLFSSFDPSRQKMINDEDSDMHKKHSPPVGRVQPRQAQPSSCIQRLCEDETSAAAAMDIAIDSGTSLSSGCLSSSNAEPSVEHEDTSFKTPVNVGKADAPAIKSPTEGASTLEKQRFLVAGSENSDSGVDSSSPCHPPATSPPSQNSPLTDATTITIAQDKVECSTNIQDPTPSQIQAIGAPSVLRNLSSPNASKDSGNLSKARHGKGSTHGSSGGRLPTQQVEKHCISSHKGVVHKEQQGNYVPNFQRPLLSKQMTNWFFTGSRSDLDDRQLILGEMASNIDVPSSLNEALHLGLNPRSDWMMRVFAFNFLQSLLQRGPKGIQEVAQSFENVMKLISRYLDDPHHKIAHAALSSLAEIIPVFRKPFESYLERMLPHVFSRLNDPKESIRQLCSTILKLTGGNYSIESLLPALLRSLDEQKSPRARSAVLEFATCSFDKCVVNSDNYYNNNFLRLWLGKIAPLSKDKNNKLKEVAVACFISIYSHYDPTSILSFIMSLSVGEEKRLRWALKQCIPALDVDLEKFLEQKKQKQHLPSFDPFSAIGQSFAKGSTGVPNKSLLVQACPADEPESNSESGRLPRKPDGTIKSSAGANSIRHTYSLMSRDKPKLHEPNKAAEKLDDTSNHHQLDNGPSISQILCQEAMCQMDDVPKINDNFGSVKRLHQMSASLLEMLDDPDTSARELALSLLVEILESQQTAMNGCIETLILKLLRATNDAAMKVVNQAHTCLTTVVTRYDPLRCFDAIAPLLVCEDEKILIVSINSLSTLVGRLSQQDLMAHLPAFLPALLDAFENHSPYVRKTVVLCLADVYLKLGAAFLPYLERLNSTQLQLVTMYANRLSQTRFIAVDVPH